MNTTQTGGAEAHDRALPADTLARGGPLPLYFQIATALRAQIASGRYRAGDLLPGETTLAAELGVNRATIRQAIGVLAAEGLVSRHRGRGTLVATPFLEQPLAGIYSFAGLAEETGSELTTQVRLARSVPADATAAERLGLRAARDTVLELERLRLLNGVPLALEHVLLAAAACDVDLQHADFTQPLYRLLDAAGITVTKAREQIRPVNLSAREARLLGQARGAAAFQVDRLGYAAEHPVEWRRSLVNGERYLYSVQLAR
jgi:GntR family transcriptional regulator